MRHMTVAAYAAQHQLSRQTVYNMIKSGRLRARRIDGVLHVIITQLYPPIGYPGNPNFANPEYRAPWRTAPPSRRTRS